ncbi:MAG: polymerase subunit gamma and tau, partial [Microbacteriaceae bacterium]|nr:polymerase subunit gamma and tau [Microbacteriaceae bacterium]
VKFIFATTEPEKVIGTIRSRTHHYPFRLVPPAQMLEYVQQLCDSEKVDVEAGVLPLVVRAGGGSVRDTLSLLDQLIAGSEGSSVRYERAVALLGYTHGALLGEVIDAIGARDAAAAFGAVDRVIQTGQDPRRFVEDLLERLRDLIIVSATSDGAAAVLRGIQQDELDRMTAQAAQFGTAELSRAADVANAALTEMTGATSPRLHLELMIARVLLPASDESERGALARIERLERRIGVEAPGASATATAPTGSPAVTIPTPPVEEPSATGSPVEETAASTSATAAPPTTVEVGPVTFQQVRDSWPEILEAVEKAKLSAWMVVYTAKPLELRDDNVLVLSFPSQNDVDALKQRAAPGEGVADYFKQAVFEVLGFRPLLLAKVEATRAVAQEAPPEPTEPDVEPPVPSGTTWETAVVTDAEPETKRAPEESTAPEPPAAVPAAAPPKAKAPATPAVQRQSDPGDKQRYGEAVVREILGASFIEEQAVTPRVAPREQ